MTDQQYTVIYTCFLPVCALVFLLFLIKKNHLFSSRQSLLFTRAVLINLLLIVLSASDFILTFETFENVWLIRRLTSMAHFALSPLMPLLLLQLYSRKKLHWTIYIPLLINAALCALSWFVNVVFFISYENTYDRGPLFLVPLAISVFYILMVMINPIATHNRGKRKEAPYLIAIIGTVLFATVVLEIALHLVCIVYGTTAVGLTMYYILQNIHYFSSDALTGAYNRQRYIHMLENISRTPMKTFALLDINDFKAINDEKGHDAGDKALVLFVSILSNHFGNMASVYRIGGDEFMIVSQKLDAQRFIRVLEVARKTAAENGLSFASGIGEYNSGDDVQALLRQIDERMYLAKNDMKASLPQ